MDEKTIQTIKAIAAEAALKAVAQDRTASLEKLGMVATELKAVKAKESSFFEEFERQLAALSELDCVVKVLSDKLQPALRQETKDDAMKAIVGYATADTDSDIVKATANNTGRIRGLTSYLSSVEQRIQLK